MMTTMDEVRYGHVMEQQQLLVSLFSSVYICNLGANI